MVATKPFDLPAIRELIAKYIAAVVILLLPDVIMFFGGYQTLAITKSPTEPLNNPANMAD